MNHVVILVTVATFFQICYCQEPIDSQQDIVVRIRDESSAALCASEWVYSTDSDYYGDFKDLELKGIVRCSENGGCTENYIFENTATLPDNYKEFLITDATYDSDSCQYLAAIDNECGSGPVTLPPGQASSGLDINLTDDILSSLTLSAELLSFNSQSTAVPTASDPIVHSVLVVPNVLSMGLSFLGTPQCYAREPGTSAWVTATSTGNSVFNSITNTIITCEWSNDQLILKVNNMVVDTKNSIKLASLSSATVNHGRYEGEVRGMSVTLNTVRTKTETITFTSEITPTPTPTGTYSLSPSGTTSLTVKKGEPPDTDIPSTPTPSDVRKFVRVRIQSETICQYPWTDAESSFITRDLTADDAANLAGVVRCNEINGCNEYYQFIGNTLPMDTVEYIPTPGQFEGGECVWIPCLWDERVTTCGDFTLSPSTTTTQHLLPFVLNINTDSVAVSMSLQGSVAFSPNIALISAATDYMAISYPLLSLSNIVTVGITIGGLAACQFRNILIVDESPLNTTEVVSLYCLCSETVVRLYVNYKLVNEADVTLALPPDVTGTVQLLTTGIVSALGDVQLQGVRIVVNSVFRGNDLPIITPVPSTEVPPLISIKASSESEGSIIAPSQSLTCPVGYKQIASLEACTVAGGRLDIPYSASLVPVNDSLDVPPGCFYRDVAVSDLSINTTVTLQGLWFNPGTASNKTPEANELYLCSVPVVSSDDDSFRNSPAFGLIFASLAGICVSMSYAYWSRIQSKRRKLTQGFYHDVENQNGKAFVCPYPQCADGPNGAKYESTDEQRLHEHISRRHVEERVLCVHRVLASFCEQCNVELQQLR